ncbi:MAG: tail fiber protein [Deltaproteobacteria bacterium]|nr:tail fiber protein [Deltaproteobacteria bacterium]
MRIELEVSKPTMMRVVVIGVVTATTLALASPFGGVPNPAQPGNPVSASQMNANFDALTAYVNQLDARLDAQAVPPGTVATYAGSVLPAGWLWCNGQSVSEDDYPELFDAIGTTYGGDGAPMFKVPDYRGRFLRGLDDGALRDPEHASRTLGSVQGDAFQGHWHAYVWKLAGWQAAQGADVSVPHPAYALNSTDNEIVRGAVSDGANGAPRTAGETRPTNVAVRFIIKW